VVGELDEFSMCSTDVPELGGAEFGEVGLYRLISSAWLIEVL
jgi:hypothetical protein